MLINTRKDLQVIIDKFVEVKIMYCNYQYFLDLGYDLKPLGAAKWGYKSQVIMAKVEDMLPGSNKYVNCQCDKCGAVFKQRIARNTDVCYPCRKNSFMKGNKLGKANKGKVISCMQGDKHPRWNPNKKEFDAYGRRVRWLTLKQKDIWSKWENADKIGKCGVEGAYQLDHKVSIAYGFYNHIPETVIASLNNLSIVTWESNRSKGKSNSIDLWDILS